MNWLLNCRFGEEFDWDVLGAACCLQTWDGWYAKILFHQGNLMNRQELLASLRRLSVMAGSFCMSGTNLLPDCGAAASARHALNLWSKKVRKTWLIANLLGCRHAEFGEPKRSG